MKTKFSANALGAVFILLSFVLPTEVFAGAAAAVAAVQAKPRTTTTMSPQACVPDGFLDVSMLPIDRQTKRVDGRLLYCLEGRPTTLLHGPSCSRYGNAAEYVQANLRRTDVAVAGLGVIHQGDEPIGVTIFYCLGD